MSLKKKEKDDSVQSKPAAFGTDDIVCPHCGHVLVCDESYFWVEDYSTEKIRCENPECNQEFNCEARTEISYWSTVIAKPS